MRASFVTYDVFTSRPFAGNPLLVVPDARGLSAREMQSIAREINFSESTFVLPADDPSRAYRQRTFVPLKEIPYAGHPTVGTAFAMAESGRLGSLPEGWSRRTIEVGFGPLGLDLLVEGGRLVRVRMEQGAPSWGEPLRAPADLEEIAAAAGVPVQALEGPLAPQVVSTGNRILIVPVRDAGDLASASPDPRRLLALERCHDVLVVYLFTAGAAPGRMHARGFCTGAGVPEDPATGSAAGPLGVYLLLHDALPGGARRFVVDQGAEMGRPSEIEVEAEGEPGAPTAARVAGTAVRVMEGTVGL